VSRAGGPNTLRVVATILALAVGVAACSGAAATVHPLGEEVVVTHAQVEGSGFTEPTTLAVAVLAVRRGTIDELEDGGFTVDEEERSRTPWYVDQRYRNEGDATLDRALRVSLENEAGDLIPAVTIFTFAGTEFDRCPDRSSGDEAFAPGDEFETCTLFFAEPGEAPARVSFLPTRPGTETDWVYWAVD
jgi:hypothetical protein